jgi:hypothetical protein
MQEVMGWRQDSKARPCLFGVGVKGRTVPGHELSVYVARMPSPTRRRSVERRQQKITLGEMRASGVRGLLIYCSDYKCSHSTAISGDRWPDQVRLSDLEARFVCRACGTDGADIRPDFNWDRKRPHERQSG